MTIDTPYAATIDPPVTAPDAGEWLVGDYYDQTIGLSLGQVGDRVQQDLYDVRYDNMLPATAEFDVTPDTDGPVPVLRITITGLVRTADNPTLRSDPQLVYETMRTVYGLTNHYNRVHLTHPEQARFIQHIAALHPNGTPAIVLIGMMHDATTPTPTPRRMATPDTAPDAMTRPGTSMAAIDYASWDERWFD